MNNFMPATNLPVLATGHDIQLLGHMNKQYVDAETIGRKLGYKFPEIAINKLYRRHKNEFKDEESCETSLVYQLTHRKGQKPYHQARKIRLFSVPKGAFRLCMISDAPNRVEVQDEILQVFDTFRFGSLIKSGSDSGPIAISEAYIKEIKLRLGTYTGNKVVKDLLNGCFDGKARFMTLEEIAKMPEGAARSSAIIQYGKAEGLKSRQQAYRKVTNYMKAIGMNKPNTKKTGKPRRDRVNKGISKHPEEKKAALEYRLTNPKAGGKEIKRKLNLTVAWQTINRWLRAA